jgi:hypothetical protein
MIGLDSSAAGLVLESGQVQNTFFIIVKRMWEHHVGLLTEAQLLCNLAHIPWNIRVKLPT